MAICNSLKGRKKLKYCTSLFKFSATYFLKSLSNSMDLLYWWLIFVPGTVLSLALFSFDKAMYFDLLPNATKMLMKAKSAEKGVCPLR